MSWQRVSRRFRPVSARLSTRTPLLASPGHVTTQLRQDRAREVKESWRRRGADSPVNVPWATWSGRADGRAGDSKRRRISPSGRCPPARPRRSASFLFLRTFGQRWTKAPVPQGTRAKELRLWGFPGVGGGSPRGESRCCRFQSCERREGGGR